VLSLDLIISSHVEPNLLHILSHLVAPSLREIYITCLIDLLDLTLDLDLEYRWSKIDHVLDGKEFSSLRRVEIVVFGRSRAPIRQTILKNFPLLISRGLLLVEHRRRI
jgi:hypothetical protein